MPKTDRQDKLDRFVEEFLVDLNATQAYLRSHPGVTYDTAATEGSKLLGKPEISEKIAAGKAERSKRTKVTQDRIIKELARIAFVDLRKAYEKGGELKDPVELPADMAHAISAIEVDTHFVRQGADSEEIGVTTRKVKFHSKVRALEVLLEHVKTTGGDGKTKAVSFVDLVKRAEEAKKARGG